MKIRFTENVELEIIVAIVTGYPLIETETFKKGDITEIEICDDLQPPFAREIQFGDGSVAFVDEDFWKSVDIDVSTL